MAICLNNLALLFNATNRPAEGEQLFRQALAIFERSFGPEHPHFRTTINNHTVLLAAMSLSKEAIALRVRSAVERGPNE